MAFVLPLLPILFAIATAVAPRGSEDRQRFLLMGLAVAAMALTALAAAIDEDDRARAAGPAISPGTNRSA